MNIIERGNLPPGVAEPREGYRETGVQLIDENCIISESRSFPTDETDWKACRYLYKVNKRLAEQSRKERERMTAFRLQMRRERREQAKRERIEEYIDWAMVVLLCAMIAVTVML